MAPIRVSAPTGMPIYADPDVVPEIWVGPLASPAGSIVILNPDSGSGKTRDLRYAERVARAHEGGLEVLDMWTRATAPAPRRRSWPMWINT